MHAMGIMSIPRDGSLFEVMYEGRWRRVRLMTGPDRVDALMLETGACLTREGLPGYPQHWREIRKNNNWWERQ
jgi:hypothetical protein